MFQPNSVGSIQMSVEAINVFDNDINRGKKFESQPTTLTRLVFVS